MNKADVIEIRRLRVLTHIGVPDLERASAQALFITLRLVPRQGFNGLADDLSRTLDYALVAEQITALAAARPRHLIETLALEIAEYLLAQHAVTRVAVTVEKVILPDTECVAVHLERGRR
ncbi:MAG: dihydroneopterin aldolase [Verrucomicrobia bacterium]|nr:MAG: dihydroneopterin aldolase [Verrucomicrobiota bacterium]